MARKKNDQGNAQAMKSRTYRKMAFNAGMMANIQPITPNQERLFSAWQQGKHMFIYGCAGTGKTFCALYNALKDTLADTPKYDSVYVVRSPVATREIPYKNMVKYMFELGNDGEFNALYEALKNQESIKFWSTSFLRGATLDNSVIIIDEMQNLNFHELDSIITRVGENSRIIFCGDAMQSDLLKDRERNGIHDFMRILESMPDDFEMIEMTVDDIVRSGLVRNYLIAKDACGITN